MWKLTQSRPPPKASVKERQGKANGKKYNLNLDHQTLKKPHFWVKRENIGDENVKWEILVKILQKLVDIYMKIWKNLYPTQEIFPQHLLRIIKLWLDWALFLTCTLF